MIQPDGSDTSLEKPSPEKPSPEPNSENTNESGPFDLTQSPSTTDTSVNNTSSGQVSENVQLQVPEDKPSSNILHGNGEAKLGNHNTSAPEISKPQFALICTNGICSSCEDANAKAASLKCLYCKLLFHAVCTTAKSDKKGSDTICARTFFNTYTATIESQVYKTRPGNFIFICDPCMTKFEQEEASTQESKVDVIDRRVTTLTNTMDEMKVLLNQVISNTNNAVQSTANPIPITNPVNEKQNVWKRSVLVTNLILKNSSGANIKRKEARIVF